MKCSIPLQSRLIFVASQSGFHLPRCFVPAHHLFGEMPQRDPVARLNALFSVHAGNGNPTSGLLLFSQMHRDGVRLDGYSFTSALAACASVPSFGSQLGCQVHALMLKTGSLSGAIPATSLLHMYSKCGSPSDAVDMFDEMLVRDVVAWNALLSCFVRHGLAEDAINAFRSMAKDGAEFTGVTLCNVLKACGSLRDVSHGKQIHAQVVTAGYDSVVMATSLMDFYSNCGMVAEAMQVFGGLKCAKDTAIYNALIAGYIHNKRYGDAFFLLSKTKPNTISLTCAFTACTESLNLKFGKQIHCIVIRQKFDSDTILCNALLDMYAKCGAISSARFVFNHTRDKNVISWSSIIDAYGSHGHGLEAMTLFKKMEEGKENSVAPNAVTFLSLLSACAHSGLLEESRECFYLMRDKYGINPSPEHYSCFIDCLGRAGKIEEAWDVYISVARAKKLTGGVCVAMLNACRVSLNLSKGEIVARHLIELEPDNPGTYVLISNFYAAFEKWAGAEDMRRVILGRGLKKQAANSQIATNDF